VTIISTALFIWLIERQNWGLVLASAANIPWWGFLVGFGCYLVVQSGNTLRWFVLLRTQDVSIRYPDALKIVLSGAFASNFLPTTIGGDAVRAVAIFRYTDRKTIALGSIMLDRMLNIFAMFCYLPVAWSVFGDLTKLPGFENLHFGALATGAAAILPENLWKTVKNFLRKVFNALKIWANRPQAFILSILVAWITALFSMSSMWIIGSQIGIQVSFIQVMAVTAVTYVLTSLPISVNGYGVREFVITVMYTALGATAEQASALALVSRFLMILATTPGAIWLSRTLSMPLEAAQAVSEDE
jgi:uncharacterized membrane protein YbhN (UPF0104 family)